MTKQHSKKYDTLYEELKQFFQDCTSGKLTVITITLLTRQAMELVQTGREWADMRGTEKKDLVLAVMDAVVEDLLNDPDIVGEDFDENLRTGILATLDMVPSFIDATVDFAKVYHSNMPEVKKSRFCCFR